MDDKGILLKAGTNEMELLVFNLGATPFGINVAKVREIIQRPANIKIPYAPLGIEGSFKLRDKVLTLVNLGKYFDMEGEETHGGEGMVIIVEFNSVRCGVLVDSVERIYRLYWDQIQAPSQYLISLNAPVTGVINIEDKVVLVADFEVIVSDILGVQSAVISEEQCSSIGREDARILVADDSVIVRKSLKRVLNKKGFENLTICTDGEQAWEALEAGKGENQRAFDLVLTDIEMPRMDGLHLTSKIKNDPVLKNTPVVLFSSLITKDNINKGKSVGADFQVSKPDGEEMISAIDACLKKRAKLETVPSA